MKGSELSRHVWTTIIFVCVICCLQLSLLLYSLSGLNIERKLLTYKNENNLAVDGLRTHVVDYGELTEAPAVRDSFREINGTFSYIPRMRLEMHKTITLPHTNIGDANHKHSKHSSLRNDTSSMPVKCFNCSTHIPTIVLDNPYICAIYDTALAIEMIILIHSAPGNSLTRNIVRQTWVSQSKNNTSSIRYAFLLGDVHNVTIRHSVLLESQAFADIIQGDFVDSYNNLTYKTIMGFMWATTRCSTAKAVMKTDDDSFVNVPNALKIVRDNFVHLGRGVVGKCYKKSNPRRNKADKWYVSYEYYPRRYYPEYCSGSGYITSYQVARQIHEISSRIPFFHIEDVFIGMCIERLGYHMKLMPGFSEHPERIQPCELKGDRLVTLEDVGPYMTKLVWNTNCTSQL